MRMLTVPVAAAMKQWLPCLYDCWHHLTASTGLHIPNLSQWVMGSAAALSGDVRCHAIRFPSGWNTRTTVPMPLTNLCGSLCSPPDTQFILHIHSIQPRLQHHCMVCHISHHPAVGWCYAVAGGGVCSKLSHQVWSEVGHVFALAWNVSMLSSVVPLWRHIMSSCCSDLMCAFRQSKHLCCSLLWQLYGSDPICTACQVHSWPHKHTRCPSMMLYMLTL